jgi:hypothetical protein
MKKTIEIVVLILLAVFGWHIYVAESANTQYWDINPFTDVATLKMPQSGVGAGIGTLIAVPMAEQKFGVYARQNVDLYAWVVPYRVNVVEGPPSPPETAPSTSPAARPAQPREQGWHVVSIESRIVESNQIYNQYSWKLVVRNDSNEPATFYGRVEFQDADGFKLDDDLVNADRSIRVAPGSDGVFTGSADLVLTKKVARTIAKISKTE